MPKLTILFLSVFILFITNPEIVTEAALNALSLWAATLLPALFPVTVVSGLLIRTADIKPVLIYPFIIIAGLLGGFPLCAILCAQQLNTYNAPDNSYNKKNALKLCQIIMDCCNISSPAFVLNYICSRRCITTFPLHTILIIIYLPSLLLLTLLLLQYFMSAKGKSTMNIRSDRAQQKHALLHSEKHITDSEKNSIQLLINESIFLGIKSMLSLCGITVIFACIMPFITKINIFSATFKSILVCVIEITNGISICDNYASQTVLSPETAAVIILCANSFGGLSTALQTSGMTVNSGLSIKKYIYHKILLAAFTLTLSIFMIYVL